MPPLSDYKEELGEIIDYNCVKSIVKIIKEVNNKCVLIEASTTSLYNDNIEASVNNKINKKTLTPYSLNKYKAEELIGLGKVKVNGNIVKEMGFKASYIDYIEVI